VTESKIPFSVRSRWRSALDVGAVILMIVASAVLIWKALSIRSLPSAPSVGRSIAVPEEPIRIDGAVAKGDSRAPVVLIEFSDFECPFCGQFARETMPVLDAKYVQTGKIRVVFKQLPLNIHPLARRAAETAACAGKQGRFWQVHDILFAQQKLSEDTLENARRALLVDDVAFSACTGLAAEDVSKDLALARQLGISGTPAFLVGQVDGFGRVRVQRTVSGARPLSDFSKAIDETLAGRR